MKFVSKLIPTIFLILVTFSCNEEEWPDFELEPADSIPEIEYQVYSVVMDEVILNYSRMIISQETITKTDFFDSYTDTLKSIIGFDSKTIDNYILSSDSKYFLGDSIMIPNKKVKLISKKEHEYIFSSEDSNKNWDRFKDQYSDAKGIYYLSRVGFNTDYTQAIVEIENLAFGSGIGYIIYLSKKEDSFEIRKIIEPWIG